MQTGDGRHGSAGLTLSCWDNGGVTYGGRNTNGQGPVAIRVFPKPKVFSVEPGYSALRGGGTVTVRGLHFGSEMSRGYWEAAYQHLTVFVGHEACARTEYVSDSELRCIGVPPGNGVSAITVSVSDPFATTPLVLSLERNGTLASSFAHILFLASGPSFLAIGSHHVALVPEAAPPVLPFLNLTAFLESSAAFIPPPTAANNSNSSNSTNSAMSFNASNATMMDEAPMVRNTTLELETLFRGIAEYLTGVLCTNRTRAQQEEAGVEALCGALPNATLPLAVLCNITTRFPLGNASSLNTTLFALLCRPPLIPEIFPPVLRTLDVGVSGVIRAITEINGRVFAGGSFVGWRTREARHIMAWRNVRGEDGVEVEPLGNGVDGAVAALARHGDLLILGGSFTAALTTRGEPVRCGGLVAWDPVGHDWVVVGRTPLYGSVAAVRSQGGILYVAGRFETLSGLAVHNIARHSGNPAQRGGWETIGGGVTGGHVAALAGVGKELFVAGEFVSLPSPNTHHIPAIRTPSPEPET